MTTLTLVFGIGIAVILGLFALTILVQIWRNKIDLKELIEDENGDASLSRFQFLIFTFVFAFGYFLEVIAAVSQTGGTAFAMPDVPQGALILLGISGASYVASKGIQTAGNLAATAPPATTVVVPSTPSTT